MAGTEQEHWPDRTLGILVPTTILCIISTVLLMWRVIYGIRTKRKLLICDYLLIVATALNVVTTAIRFQTCRYGQGRHILDPSISKPHDILKYMYYLWIGQVINLIAVAVLKYSICAYLLALKFSKVYLGVVWVSILMITGFNLIVPIMGCFGTTPFEANWNKTIPGKHHVQIGIGLTYAQGVSNCVTDVVYVVAPIIYLSTIQLSRRTQWGLRTVFCLGLVVTACSIVKTVELSALLKTRDPTWDGSNLAIWSATELSVGVLIASLPPLRKQFDAFFRRVIPSTFLGTKSKTRPSGNGIPLYNVTIGSRAGGGRSRTDKDDDNDDGDSERHILKDSEQPGKNEITKTVVHEVRSEDRQSVQLPDRMYDAY